MKVFVLPATYPNRFNPGAGNFIYEQNKMLAGLGHEVIVLDASTYNYRRWLDVGCFQVKKETDEMGARYVLHARGLMTSRLPRLHVHFYKRKIKILYNRAVSEYGRPDILIAHFSLPSGFTAIDLAKKENIPCVIVEHYSLFLSEHLHPYTKKQLVKAVCSANSFICVSKSLKKMIETHTGIAGKIQVIPNMVHSRFTYAAAPAVPPFTFFSAGTLTKNKRFDLLIKAFCAAFQRDEPVLLRIAGSGAEHDNLQKLISASGRSEQISLLGYVPRENIAQEYRNCHCFALFSAYETFGIVYREAMAVGRPVISTKNGGIEENWEDEFGILVDKDDFDGAVKALRKMFEDYTNYNSKKISEATLERYSGQTISSELDTLLNEILISKPEEV